MKSFTLKSVFALLLFVAFSATKLYAQPVTATASPSSIPSSSLPQSVTLTGTLNNPQDNNHFVNANVNTFWAGPGGGITVGSTSITATTAIATANIPSGTSAGTYTFTLTYRYTGDNGTTNGSITATVTITGPAVPTATLSPSTTQNIVTGGTVSFTATASNYAGSGNYTYTWTAAGATIPGSNPNTIVASSDTKILTFPAAGTYTVSVTIARSGAGTLTTNTTTVNVVTPNLWATSSDGTQISSFTVSNGTYIAGPTNLFPASFPGTTTGGTSTAALGRNAQGGIANGYFYWLPNTSGNNGVVEVFASTANGGSVTRIGSADLNGGSSNSLGFVRLGMGPDGTGWILAGDGTNLYLAKFASNGVNPVTITTVPVSLSGGTISTFQNGDVCVSGNNTMYALANNGSGLTQIFIGTLSNPTVTLTQKWNLVDQNNVPFTGSVNGVAFDAVGSLYISTATGLFYINQATVNGPAGTVQCALVQLQTGLQDLASNVFPAQSTLPVKLSNFAVSRQGNNAVLDWTTSTETNSNHFEIERSYDGINFTKAGNKQASGNSVSDINYQFIDPITISSGIIYYRLKTVDIDGRSTYSKIVVLRLSGGIIKNFTVYPNPFTSDLKLQISSDKETAITIRISNALGQPVLSRNVTLQKGENIVVFSSELQNLKPGMHLMEIISEDGKLTQKIIKQ